MEPIRIRWATQSYKLDSVLISSQRCVNYYAEKEPQDAKTDIAVIGSPGVVPWVTAGSGSVRGFNVMNDILYVVSGQSFYSVTVAGDVTLLGSGIAGFGPVSMANNTFQVEIVNGVDGWIYAPSETYQAASATVVGGGSGYAVGDTWTEAGGTFSTPAVFLVETVSAPITGTLVDNPGSYTVQQSNPVSQASTSGTGSGATFNLTWSSTSPYQVVGATPVAGGIDYQVGDTIVLAGGTFTTAATIFVQSVGNGAILTVSVQTSGQYSQTPTNPASQATTSGVGSGGTLDITYSGPPTGFNQITDPNFFSSYTVTFFDEYFLLTKVGSNIWFFSNILDGSTYNALDFEAAVVESNFVKTIINQQENVLIFCEKSIETWYDSGANDNPFARYGSATIERGCATPYVPLKEDNSVFFLGDDLVFYRLDGVLLRRMSTHAIEQAWQKYPTVSDAYAFSYTFNGHKFITIQFPSAQATWVFDIATNLWHERISYNAQTPFQGSWRGACAVVFNNQVLIGDSQSGQIGYLSEDVYTEFGSPMIGIMDSPPVEKDRKRVFIAKLEINMRVGTGLNSGQGSDPQVMLEISRDQGQTYGIRQLWQSMGKMGAYATRLIWKKLGVAYDWRFRVVISDSVPRAFIATYVTADIEEV